MVVGDEMLDADGKAWKLPDECLLLCQSVSVTFRC